MTATAAGSVPASEYSHVTHCEPGWSWNWPWPVSSCRELPSVAQHVHPDPDEVLTKTVTSKRRSRLTWLVDGPDAAMSVETTQPPLPFAVRATDAIVGHAEYAPRSPLKEVGAAGSSW